LLGSEQITNFGGRFKSSQQHFGGIQQFFGIFNSSQQQSTAVNSSQQNFGGSQQQSTKFRGHSTAVNKISGAFNSSQHDIQHDIQNGRFVRLLES
jgi:hypothetical protein